MLTDLPQHEITEPSLARCSHQEIGRCSIFGQETAFHHGLCHIAVIRTGGCTSETAKVNADRHGSSATTTSTATHIQPPLLVSDPPPKKLFGSARWQGHSSGHLPRRRR
jgi:hypothetical protein